MSDLFTEREHYIWMLNVCLDLSQSHHHEDLLLHQYIIIAAAKAMAISITEVFFTRTTDTTDINEIYVLLINRISVLERKC